MSAHIIFNPAIFDVLPGSAATCGTIVTPAFLSQASMLSLMIRGLAGIVVMRSVSRNSSLF
jgi:hypothetical protein